MAKGPYRIRLRQGPGEPDAKSWARTSGRSASSDGLAAGLQAPGVEGFAFWNQPGHRPPRRLGGGDDGASKDTADRSRKDARQSASLIIFLVAAEGRAGWFASFAVEKQSSVLRAESEIAALRSQ